MIRILMIRQKYGDNRNSETLILKSVHQNFSMVVMESLSPYLVQTTRRKSLEQYLTLQWNAAAPIDFTIWWAWVTSGTFSRNRQLPNVRSHMGNTIVFMWGLIWTSHWKCLRSGTPQSLGIPLAISKPSSALRNPKIRPRCSFVTTSRAKKTQFLQVDIWANRMDAMDYKRLCPIDMPQVQW